LRVRPGDGPLALRYEITVAPSASLWHHLRRAPRPASGSKALAFADPELPAAHGEAVHRAAGIFRYGLNLGRLPRARDEARSLMASLGGDGQVLEGAEASEQHLKSLPLREYGVLHLAAHAIVDPEESERSAVVLAAGGPEEDGLLQPREIAALDLTGRVVVLSACESAGGEIVDGEGVLGLTRAFFQARARAVVGNLWPMRDDEAEELVTDLSERLGEGERLGQALAETRRAWIREGRPAAAWASLTLQGDGDLVLAAVARRPVWPWIGLGAGLFLGLSLVLVLITRQRSDRRVPSREREREEP
jgi:CHAT domain-containing protein